jgi:hypothetical protein
MYYWYKSNIKRKMKRVDLMIFSALIYGLVFTLTGCEKDMPKEEPNYYLGKWKIMSVNFAWTTYSGYPTPPIFDFSEEDIMYHFYMDGYMFVSGEMAGLDLDSNIERDCLNLYLRYGIGTGGYKYTTSIHWETVDWETDWALWSLKVGDKDYGLTAYEDRSQMRITKGFPYNEVPWVDMRTASSDDVLLSAWFEVYLVKVEE